MKEITSEKNQVAQQVANFLQTIQTQAYRCKNITQNLLNLVRKSELTMEEVELNGILDEILSLVNSGERKYNLRIVKDYHPEGVYLTADPTLMRQILLNIFSNAADAIEGKGDISLATQELDEKLSVVI